MILPKDGNTIVSGIGGSSKSKSTGSSSLNPVRVMINGVLYDATNFQKRHPGGNVIAKFDMSKVPDATDAFNNFHHGSVRAQKMLKGLPVMNEEKESTELESKSVKDADTVISADFRTMLEGWDTKGHYEGGQLEFFIWGLVVTMSVYFSYWLMSHGYPIAGGIVVGFAWGQCGFVQHHAGHLAFTGIPHIDYSVQAFFESVLKGSSARWWRNRHNKHHAMPNSIEHDGDLRTTPFFAWDEVLIKKIPTSFLRIQHFMFIPLLGKRVYTFVMHTFVHTGTYIDTSIQRVFTCVYIYIYIPMQTLLTVLRNFDMQEYMYQFWHRLCMDLYCEGGIVITQNPWVRTNTTMFLPIDRLIRQRACLSIIYLYSYLSDYIYQSIYLSICNARHWDEMAMIVVHWCLASCFYVSATSFITFYLVGFCVQGIYLGVMFGMSHYTMPRVSEETDCWARWQLDTACNW